MPDYHFLKDIVEEVNSLRDPCKDTFLSPSGVRRLFLLMLRGHWSAGSNHGADLKDSLSCLYWSPENDRPLDIELQGSETAADAGDNAIFIKVGNFQFKRVSFGARSAVSEDNAEVIYTYPATCEAIFGHHHKNLDTAFDMAWSTFSFFSGYAEPISDAIGLSTKLDPLVVGEPNLVEDDPQQRYRVDFAMRITLNVSVSTTQESHRLKRAFDTFTP